MMATVSVRYIVDDVNTAVAFYTEHLRFSVERQPAPGFAILSRGDLRLLLSAGERWVKSTAAAGGEAAHDGRRGPGRRVDARGGTSA